MIKTMNGFRFVELMNAGIKNLEKNRKRLNDLNVFPVPDGDTGTNMVMTLRCGIGAVGQATDSLSETADKFSAAAVFGARGNSGVIISQFFKGISSSLAYKKEVDAKGLCDAVKNGYVSAYGAVAKPVEGTMLTVMRDAAEGLEAAMPLESIDEAINVYVNEAKQSLARTPELLPILKKAGVVDSGAAGLVCLFEGIQKCLAGESIEFEDVHSDVESIDLSKFNKNTPFEYGYCVEGVLQLTIDECDFVHDAFKNEICLIGDSLVSSLEGDKVKVHVHVKSLGDLFNYCSRFGEFLTVKIENMSVQQILNEPEDEDVKQPEKFLRSDIESQASFAVVAVATTPEMQAKFADMGADVVILSDIAPSSQDFLDAYDMTGARDILVFPNSSNSILASMQAASFYKKARVNVLNSRSLSECYACLSVMDFDGDVEDAITLSNSTITGIYQLSIYHAVKDVTFGSRNIARNEFFAISGKDIISVGDTLANATVSAVSKTLEKTDAGVITLFFGKYISSDYIELLSSDLSKMCNGAEIASVSTYETACDLTITFE